MKKETEIKQKKIYHSPSLIVMGNLVNNTLGSDNTSHNDQHGSPNGKGIS